MTFTDLIPLIGTALSSQRLRSSLTALGIAIGITAVVLLTSIGEGIRQYVLSEFTQFGTHLVGINPGRTTTTGGAIGVFGSVRPLTIDDAMALRRARYIEQTVAILQGNAEVESRHRRRRTTVYAVGHAFPQVLRFNVAIGRFLPADDPNSARPFAVLGSTLHTELYAGRNPLGERIRIGGEGYRIIGVMQSKGQILGFDIDDAVYIPAAKGLELFNRDGLMEIDVLYKPNTPVTEVTREIKRILVQRHGDEDFTLTTQEQMLDILDSVLNVLTFAVAALGGISLLVGAVGIVTIMTIAVNERVNEIGVLRALGATQSQILRLFMAEAILLAGLGGVLGLILGLGLAGLLQLLLPALPIHTPWHYALAAEILAVVIGLAAGVLPARHAANLDPVEALRAE